MVKMLDGVWSSDGCSFQRIFRLLSVPFRKSTEMATRAIKAITRLQCARLLLSQSRIPASRSTTVFRHFHTNTRTLQAQPVAVGKQGASFHQAVATDDLYDVVIVGGGVAGTALACSLGILHN